MKVIEMLDIDREARLLSNDGKRKWAIVSKLIDSMNISENDKENLRQRKMAAIRVCDLHTLEVEGKLDDKGEAEMYRLADYYVEMGELVKDTEPEFNNLLTQVNKENNSNKNKRKAA